MIAFVSCAWTNVSAMLSEMHARTSFSRSSAFPGGALWDVTVSSGKTSTSSAVSQAVVKGAWRRWRRRRWTKDEVMADEAVKRRQK